MKIAISTACLFPMLTEQALRAVFSTGCRTAEVFVNTPSETAPGFAKELRAIAAGCGGRITAIHPCTSEYEGVSFFGRYPRRFDDAAEDYRHYFEMCGIVGAGVVVFHGARSFLKIPPELYFERFGRLSEIARSFSVELCHENVVRFHCESPEFVREMRRALPDAGFLLDVKQAVRSGVDPFEMLDAMGKNLRHIHVSDHDAGHDCLPPGKGNFELKKFLHSAKRYGFDGCASIELYRRNFNALADLENSYKYMRLLLED